MRYQQLLLPALVLLAVSCGRPIGEGEEAVADFRARAAAQDYEAIYSETTEGFRAETSLDQFQVLMAGLEEKMGPHESSTREDFKLFYGTSGSRVTLIYSSEFANGPAQESFVWHLGRGVPLLHEYRIDSPVFLEG